MRLAEDYLPHAFPIGRQKAFVPEGPSLGIAIDEEKVARFAHDLQASNKNQEVLHDKHA